jgi:hypothetical protein
MTGPQFHYIRNEKLGEELYDWRNDPEEHHDLAKNKDFSSELQVLRDSLEHHGTPTIHLAGQPVVADPQRFVPKRPHGPL